MRILSGIQPSGSFHIGNYFGMMKKMIEYQEQHELFCFIANLHAMTTVADGELLAKQTLDAATTFLALGLDPEKAIFWVQSDVPEVNLLTWVLSNFTPLGLLERCHSYKDKIARGFSPHTGLFTYPVLMAADILLYQSERVPVGQDQKQHLEVTRDIALKFNGQYGQVFTIPEPEISEEVAVVPGTDGQKMSKSYGNTIEIFAEKSQLQKKVMSIVTDSKSVEEPKDPDSCNVFKLYRLFLSRDEAEALRQRYLQGGVGYGEVKKALAEAIWQYFTPHRERKKALEEDREFVRKILKAGAEKARSVANETMKEVSKRVGIIY
ncbi:MAG: tryptophan--tRNA ligase [bacterium]|nr:tryptophan--tRNA ligase [bacterium]